MCTIVWFVFHLGNQLGHHTNVRIYWLDSYLRWLSLIRLTLDDAIEKIKHSKHRNCWSKHQCTAMLEVKVGGKVKCQSKGQILVHIGQ